MPSFPTSSSPVSSNPRRLNRVIGWGLFLAVPVCLLPSFPVFGQMATGLINPLVAAWIRSEVDEVENLNVQVIGSDAQLFNGTIPQANVSGDNLLYQGFQISSLQLQGSDIRLNVAEAIQGRPLRVLTPVPVQVSLRLTEDDLNKTLQSPLIQEQLAQAQVSVPIGNQTVPFLISDPSVSLELGQMRVQANLAVPNGDPLAVTFTTGLAVIGENQLQLVDPNWISDGQSIPIPALSETPLQLDPGVRIDRLELAEGELLYAGLLTIMP
ncbi:MAG: DUF2993 domain-containing protein [Synechococcaceae cyanobacterium RM1_1_27]|nr:DUF2993 domain-containing protein [Synechococcaceae cyanobacterium SM2_3_2]NJO85977.1 DUF2993 domain-containing protein [Synechococcaceae cyanobacterium RM1_1_27]